MAKIYFSTALSHRRFLPLGKIVSSVLPAQIQQSMASRQLPDICKNCGSPLSLIGPAPVPHRASLHCKECRAFRGWVSNDVIQVCQQGRGAVRETG